MREVTKAVVLLSGGMDSLVCAGIAKRDNDNIYFLHANYGQRTETKELDSFKKLTTYFKPVDTLNVNIDYLKKIGGNSLTDRNIKIHENQNIQEIPNTYVPFRNANLICIATSWAEVLGAQRIYIGAVEQDSSGYPDCRQSFYNSMNQAIELGTKDETKIEIVTPIIHLSKKEIVLLGTQLNLPFELSWSCYQSEDKACGKCDSCQLRIKAFKEAKIIDPINYHIDIDWSTHE